MDGRQTEFQQQPGLSPPYPSFNEADSQDSAAEQASAAQFPQQAQQDARHGNFSPSATPTSEYAVNPSSARSATFPEYVQRPYGEGQQRFHPPSGQGANAGGMAQPTSPSMPMPDGQANNHNDHNIKSDQEVPIDPSIAQSSPSYPPQGQFSPYAAQHDMAHFPPHAAVPGVYQRPDWAGPGNYPPHHPQHMYGHPATTGPNAPGMVSPVARPPAVSCPEGTFYRASSLTVRQGGHPLSTVYSFVPIPGAQQHKRPRRRYEEIERMYKCGWNGCEKAYGTLNHLNAHVTMQSHGTKRTPEGEFAACREFSYSHFPSLVQLSSDFYPLGTFWSAYVANSLVERPSLIGCDGFWCSSAVVIAYHSPGSESGERELVYHRLHLGPKPNPGSEKVYFRANRG